MSYETRIYGEIAITPPLPYAEFRNSLYRAAAVRRSDTTLIFSENVATVDTPTGVNHDITAVGITVRYDQPGNHYRIKDELAEMVQGHSDHEFIGGLVSVGADPGDIVRYRVQAHVTSVGGKAGFTHEVIEEKAVLRWPDGTKVEF